jgi:hypothetical protein
MRLGLLVLLLATLTTGSPEPKGRRLMQRRWGPPTATRQQLGDAQRLEERRRLQKAAAVRESPDAALESAGNRTALLLRERAALLRRVAEIDAEIDRERDSRRAALTAKYEAELAALDAEAERLRGASDGVRGLGDQIAAALVAHRRAPDGTVAHQDVAHQDVDIDVVLTHIDADGDGVITKAEAKSASAGALFVQLGPSAAMGCLAGALCYIACRICFRYRRGAPVAVLQPRGGAKVLRPGAVGGSSGKSGSAAEVPPNARMRKRHAECGPAVAC